MLFKREHRENQKAIFFEGEGGGWRPDKRGRSAGNGTLSRKLAKNGGFPHERGNPLLQEYYKKSIWGGEARRGKKRQNVSKATPWRGSASRQRTEKESPLLKEREGPSAKREFTMRIV